MSYFVLALIVAAVVLFLLVCLAAYEELRKIAELASALLAEQGEESSSYKVEETSIDFYDARQISNAIRSLRHNRDRELDRLLKWALRVYIGEKGTKERTEAIGGAEPGEELLGPACYMLEKLEFRGSEQTEYESELLSSIETYEISDGAGRTVVPELVKVEGNKISISSIEDEVFVLTLTGMPKTTEERGGLTIRQAMTKE